MAKRKNDIPVKKQRSIEESASRKMKPVLPPTIESSSTCPEHLPGLGLGLYIAAEFIKRQVWKDMGQKQYRQRLDLLLFITLKRTLMTKQQTLITQPGGDSSSKAGKKRILIVDDTRNTGYFLHNFRKSWF